VCATWCSWQLAVSRFGREHRRRIVGFPFVTHDGYFSAPKAVAATNAGAGDLRTSQTFVWRIPPAIYVDKCSLKSPLDRLSQPWSRNACCRSALVPHRRMLAGDTHALGLPHLNDFDDLRTARISATTRIMAPEDGQRCMELTRTRTSSATLASLPLAESQTCLQPRRIRAPSSCHHSLR